MRALNVLIALGVLFAVLGLVLGKRRETRAPAWLLLRALFPSWRFFENITPAPSLSYRVTRAPEDFGAWQDALPPVPRTPLSLLLNARGNLYLASQSLVERLFDELDAIPPEEVSQSVSYQLVERLVLTRLGDAAEPERGRRYQFRLTLPEGDQEVCFVSEVHQG